MSDGHFNRSLLPSNNYASGVRAGKSQMRQSAMNIFQEVLGTHLTNLSEQEREKVLYILHDRLNHA